MLRPHRFVLFFGPLVASAALLQCVGDVPVAQPSVDAGGNDVGPDVGSPADTGVDGSGDAGICVGVAGCPLNVQATKLALWLRADNGVVCDTSISPARVKQWNDLSGTGRNAKPRNTYVGPRCGPQGETIKGKQVPAFRPVWGEVDSGGPALNETLDVDLSWLSGTDYTIFAVEHRSDAHVGQGILATEYFTSQSGYEASCTPDGGLKYADLNYNAPGGPPTAAYYIHHCSLPAVVTLLPYVAVTDPPHVFSLVFSSSTGRSFFVDGNSVATSGDKAPLALPSGNASLSGAIGRTHNARIDNRYYGGIAEIIGYASALSGADRGAVEAYLTKQWK